MSGETPGTYTFNNLYPAVKRSVREDKRKYLGGLAQDAENAAANGNLREVYSITKRLSGKCQSGDKPIRARDGKLLTIQEEQKNRWKEHFAELLNRPPPDNPPYIEPTEVDLEIDLEPPSTREILGAIKKQQLRNNKAAEPDGIPRDAIKGSAESSAKALTGLFQRIWTTEVFPQEWKEGHIVKLPKKENLQECRHYRGITLLSVPGKEFNRVILERLKVALDGKLREEQAGFRKLNHVQTK
ncbi:endonuclease-reverse transcriptase [Elysia marginata]|uniref:Endonuclease-reverse transcriptase n=1 Tax=Elysia marginata TaxID=1093978 RepID=A0AAV4JQJ6_9GAST|nr:endonuclease-reverse transcriptase [Elysia marginata]